MKIFIARDVGIGDMVMCNQVAKSVKRKFPKATLVFGCGPSPMSSLLETNPFIDEIISFPDNAHPRRALRRAQSAIDKYLENYAKEYDKIIYLFPPDSFASECLENNMHLIE